METIERIMPALAEMVTTHNEALLKTTRDLHGAYMRLLDIDKSTAVAAARQTVYRATLRTAVQLAAVMGFSEQDIHDAVSQEYDGVMQGLTARKG